MDLFDREFLEQTRIEDNLDNDFKYCYLDRKAINWITEQMVFLQDKKEAAKCAILLSCWENTMNNSIPVKN